ncbi:hypothetical protein C8Q79DRAFT_783790 [Trametes meyenii]|nr:hypothetical protein C8Q79DRAFT_783790 [Trametes meyenii]
MDSFNNITLIPGSRRPIQVPVFPDTSSSSSHTPPPTSVDSANCSPSTSRNRRKPTKTYQSPCADEPAGWEGYSFSRKRATSPYERPQQRQKSTETTRSSPPVSIPARRAAAQRKVPLLPLYHPFGTLAQSLPELDPGLFGLPSSLNIEDADDQTEGDAGRRSASRTQRSGGKPRDREAADDDAQSQGTPNGATKAAQEVQARNASPRKRRGGGAKRKRKDADDGDTAFPPPAKRTRNPRGANASAPAAPSPLVSEAVVASDLVENVAEGNAEAEDEPPAPKRSARVRKPRTRPAKRRDSSGSASTATSVSVSMAATTKPTAPEKPEPEPEPEPAVEPVPSTHVSPAVEPMLEAHAPPAVAPAQETPVQREDAAITADNEVTKTHMDPQDRVPEELPQPPAIEVPVVIPPPRNQPSPKTVESPPPSFVRPPSPRSVPSLPPVHAVPLVPPIHSTASPVSSANLVPPTLQPPQREEREEGELSDE